MGEWRGRATPGSHPDRADDRRRHPGRPRHRASELRRALAGRRVPQRARHEPARELRGRARRRRGRRLRRPVGHGRRGAHHDLRRRSALAPPRRRASGCSFALLELRERPARARGDPRGPALEHAGPPAVREVRLPAGRHPAALLLRQRRGRADHDDRRARLDRDARAHRAPPRRARGPSDRCRAPTRSPSPARPTTCTGDDAGPLVLAVESSCDETGIALVEGGAGFGRTSSRARSRCTRRPAGSCPRSPPAPTCAGSCPCSTRRGRAPARRGTTSAPSPSRAAPGSRARCSSGINVAKTLAWVHDKPFVGVNHLEGHVYAAWLRDPGPGRGRGAAVPAGRARRLRRAHLPRRDDRPPDVPAPRPDGRRRRGRGVRQGRAAARPAVPRRPGDPAGRRGGDRPRRARSRAPGSATRTTSASPA